MGSSRFVDFEVSEARSCNGFEEAILSSILDLRQCDMCGEKIARWHQFCYACGRPNVAADEDQQPPECTEKSHLSLDNMAFCPDCGLCLSPAVWRRTISMEDEDHSYVQYDLFRLSELVASITINSQQNEIVVFAPFTLRKFWRDLQQEPNMCDNTRRLLFSSKDRYIALEEGRYIFAHPQVEQTFDDETSEDEMVSTVS